MTVTLPENIAALQKMSEGEVKLELALSLYAGRKLTLVQAADLAGMNLFVFQAALRDRRIPQHYSERDLEEDMTAFRNP